MKKYILKELEHFFLQLGAGFSFVGSEYKINLEGKYYYIDLLLFNYKLNSFVAVELKLNSVIHKDIGQILFYMNIIDNTLKENYHNKTIGIIVSKNKDKFILEYVSDKKIFLTTYKITSTS